MPKEFDDDLDLEEETVCPNCGHVCEDETVCPNCGAIIAEEEEDLEDFNDDEEM